MGEDYGDEGNEKRYAMPFAILSQSGSELVASLASAGSVGSEEAFRSWQVFEVGKQRVTRASSATDEVTHT